MRALLLAAALGFAPASALTFTNPLSTTTLLDRPEDFARAALNGVVLQDGTLRASGASGTVTLPAQAAAAFDELIPSWNAVTPASASVTVEARAQVGGRWTRYYSFGTWTSAPQRSSLDGQEDATGQVLTDTLRLNQKATAYQLRVTLRGAARLARLAVNTSDRARRTAGAGQASDHAAWGTVLNVPQRSQMLYPDGGEVWCSPTSTSMLLAYHGVNVTVPDAARATFDRAYDGTGNWPFNMAFAGERGLRAFVTRLPSLAAAEAYVRAGLPVGVSLGWKRGELPGAAIPESSGHLMVLVGFDRAGNPVLNDPAAPTDAGVRRTYPRAAFERLWLAHSGGLTYVVTKPGAPLPQ
ncbi:peptidase C39 family protein [Deinococcus maricopensis]|uniref:Peptidase C39-like domain-containing protein n=1 Tax=Deinococcus maricopensis (strain DSM 21211 / LMG 22137 / NRRL B-23946 / LB-34) TaxID=709986 RepID=E8U5P9_DEIML|nr:peptidase C39 family protein [Deinococcus maricopensis]ADV66388.1 hypothetical protein Deima_0732 [Deinococcus maricopensis DSM 21211]